MLTTWNAGSLAKARPCARGALLIGVDQEDLMSPDREAGGNVDGEGRLSDPPFLIEE